MNIWVENQAHRKSANSYAEMICFYSLNKLTITFLLSLSSLLFFSCSKESGRKCFGTTGKDTKVIHSLAPFSEISIDDFFAVYLKQDTSDFIEIEAGEKLLPRIRFEQSGNNLRLANDNICNWSRDYSRVIKLTVHFKTLMLIEVNEACDIFSIDTIQSDSLNIVINTAVSTLDVKLNCKKTYLTIHAGTGDFTLSGISHIG